MPVAGAAVNALALLVAVVMTFAFGSAFSRARDAAQRAEEWAGPARPADAQPPRPPERPRQTTTALPAREREEWTDAGSCLVEQGGIRVGVEKASVGNVPTVDLGGKGGASAEELLIVVTWVENRIDSRLVPYRTWNGEPGGRLAPAQLADNFGNAYTQIDFGLFEKALGSLRGTTDLHPGKRVEDWLVFKPPVEKATYLRLKLPSSHVGGQGDFRLEIPVSMIRR